MVTCIEVECDRTVHCRGYCRRHYNAHWKAGRFGEPGQLGRGSKLGSGVVDLEGQRFGGWTVIGPYVRGERGEVRWPCRCDCGTERTQVSNNLRLGGSCTSCQYRARRLAEWTPCSYDAAHSRVKSRRGKASAHDCADGCGRKATGWAYQHTDPDELTEDVVDRRNGKMRRLAYSPNPEHFRPLCNGCHTKFDHAHALVS